MQNSVKLGAFITVVFLCVLLVAVLVVTKASVAITSQSFIIDGKAVVIPQDAASVVRGQHLVQHVAGCTACHGADLGGKTLVQNRNFGTIASSNLTGLQEPVINWVRAIRNGVGADDHALWLMPAPAYSALSDTDLGAMIAYIRALPHVFHELPAKRLGPFGRIAVVVGRAPLVHAVPEAQPIQGLTEAPTAEYGGYLARIARCTTCHGTGMNGGGSRTTPDPGDVRPSFLSTWGEADFAKALRQGLRPDGSKLDPTMPYAVYAGMNDVEVKALWLFLQGLH